VHLEDKSGGGKPTQTHYCWIPEFRLGSSSRSGSGDDGRWDPNDESRGEESGEVKVKMPVKEGIVVRQDLKEETYCLVRAASTSVSKFLFSSKSIWLCVLTKALCWTHSL